MRPLWWVATRDDYAVTMPSEYDVTAVDDFVDCGDSNQFVCVAETPTSVKLKPYFGKRVTHFTCPLDSGVPEEVNSVANINAVCSTNYFDAIITIGAELNDGSHESRVVVGESFSLLFDNGSGMNLKNEVANPGDGDSAIISQSTSCQNSIFLSGGDIWDRPMDTGLSAKTDDLESPNTVTVTQVKHTYAAADFDSTTYSDRIIIRENSAGAQTEITSINSLAWATTLDTSFAIPARPPAALAGYSNGVVVAFKLSADSVYTVVSSSVAVSDLDDACASATCDVKVSAAVSPSLRKTFFKIQCS